MFFMTLCQPFRKRIVLFYVHKADRYLISCLLCVFLNLGVSMNVFQSSFITWNTLCGFRIFFGSNAFLIPLINSMVSVSRDSLKYGFFANPIPCSPDTFPPNCAAFLVDFLHCCCHSFFKFFLA